MTEIQRSSQTDQDDQRLKEEALKNTPIVTKSQEQAERPYQNQGK